MEFLTASVILSAVVIIIVVLGGIKLASWYEKYEPLPVEQWDRLPVTDIYRYLSPRDELTSVATQTPTQITAKLVPRKQALFDAKNKPIGCYVYLGHQPKGSFINHGMFLLSSSSSHSVIKFSGNELVSSLVRTDIWWRPRDGAMAILKPVDVKASLFGPVNPYRARKAINPPF